MEKLSTEKNNAALFAIGETLRAIDERHENPHVNSDLVEWMRELQLQKEIDIDHIWHYAATVSACEYFLASSYCREWYSTGDFEGVRDALQYIREYHEHIFKA